MSDKRIPELNPAASTAKQGKFAIYDPFDDETVQIGIQPALGAVRANADWQADTTYAIDDIVIFQGLTVWKSLQNSNTGNVPSENTWWTELSISEADGITDTQWAAGVFTYDDSKVIYQNTAYYLQTAAPFESSDIAAEIIAGDWSTSSAGTLPSLIFVPTGGTFTTKDIGAIKLIIYLTQANATYVLPTIVSLSSSNFTIELKNESGGNVTISASDTIDGDSLIQLVDGENLTIAAGTSEYNLL